MTLSENILSAFSQMYFFEEFVQDNLVFVDQRGNEEELADLLLNLGDVIIAIQIKEREEANRTKDAEKEKKWFDNKTRLAKKQVKKTIKAIKEGNMPPFPNKRGIKKAVRADAEIIPLVVFMNDSISDYPHVLEKHSNDGQTINCISLSDFQMMCKELISPAEIINYLKYRCDFYSKYGDVGIIVYEATETEILISKPTKNEKLIKHYLIEEYGIDELRQGKEQYEKFRWFLRESAIRSTTGRDSEETFSILLFLAHFNRKEIRAFGERVLLARDNAQKREYGIVGSIRRDDSYAIFFVSTLPNHVCSMDYLLEQAHTKCNPKVLVQVYVWWENDEDYHIDYLLWDLAIE